MHAGTSLNRGACGGCGAHNMNPPQSRMCISCKNCSVSTACSEREARGRTMLNISRRPVMRVCEVGGLVLFVPII